MEKGNTNNAASQDSFSGKQGEYGIAVGYERIWDRLKEDIGIKNIIILLLGSILLIFSPEKGWEFDVPYLNYTLAYRGWIGLLCFICVIISFCLRKKSLSHTSINLAETKLDGTPFEGGQMIPGAFSIQDGRNQDKTDNPEATKTKKSMVVKSMYIHFSEENKKDLTFMMSQLDYCRVHTDAMILLSNFKTMFNGKLFISTFPQPFAVMKSIPTKGQNDKEWCWWYWDGGDNGFQLIVSLCQ